MLVSRSAETMATGVTMVRDTVFPVGNVADPWGEVRMRHAAGAAHDLPSPAELVDWARFVAMQCPECEGEAL